MWSRTNDATRPRSSLEGDDGLLAARLWLHAHHRVRASLAERDRIEDELDVFRMIEQAVRDPGIAGHPGFAGDRGALGGTRRIMSSGLRLDQHRLLDGGRHRPAWP